MDGARRDPSSASVLKYIGDVFTDLQDARHSADYDPGYRIASTDLEFILSDVELAIRVLADLPAAERKLLAARLIGRARG